MTTREFGDIELRRVREHVWEIPQEGEMNAPARVLASEALLEQIGQDKTLEQLRNATHLPGIANHAICMPDGHQGYGFPVGGVGATDTTDGCISPGAVGYDINCLPGEASVRLHHGRKVNLETLRDRFETEQATVVGDELTSSPIRLFTESGKKQVYEVETETGDTLRATADHELLTPEGKVPLRELEAGDAILRQPFEGLPDEEPSDEVILTADDFADEHPQLVSVLEERGVLPLRASDEGFNRLLKLVGFHIGDGSFGSAGQTWFYGEPRDLESVRRDVRAVGFKPSKVYSRNRDHEIDGRSFTQTEYSFKATSKAFRKLLVKLGAPEGKKIASGFETPSYFDTLTTWQKALFYSAYFGAEMNGPAAQHDKNLYCPKVSQTRTRDTADAGKRFFSDMASFLSEVGVETNRVECFETESNAEHDTVRLRLGIKNDSETLLRFYSTIGYRYNHEKRKKSVVAIEYLKRKQREIQRRSEIAAQAKAMADGGRPVSQIAAQFEINDRFIERSVWDGRTSPVRPREDFPTFESFAEGITIRDDLTVASKIDSISEAGTERVFDIGVEHDAHNFVADGFVVSNCGVRMMTTNLTYEDLQGTEEELVNALFEAIPSGLGGGGVVRGDAETIEDILERGMQWALDEGYATEDDLAHCEDEGFRDDARPEFVSQKAKDRGRNQIGSLGSGNHFLEVQRVTDIYRDDVAESFGLEADQVVVLIHCGSRGLGHQTCTDYLRRIEKEHKDLLDELPDKELAAAPAGSELAEEYYGAMCAAINFAWVNRQLIMHRTREVFADVFDRDWRDMEMRLLYDVAHNIAKKEVHAVDGEDRELYVHRKGATRAFPAGRPELPPAYADVGQPVIIPGSMGAGSYVLRGGEKSLELTFGSTAHGAGRLMSRTKAKQEYWGETVQEELREQEKIYVKAQSGATVAEEAPGVYKDVDEVVRVSDELGIGDKVARTYPVCNIKG